MKPRALLRSFVLGILCIIAAGCTTKVPTTKIRLGSYSGEFPKQFRAESLTISVNPTNGVLLFQATNLVAENEPNVIAAQGMADAARIGAMLSGAGVITSNAISAGVGAALKLK